MGRKLPPWLAARHEDPERKKWAARTPEERLAIFVEVCEVDRAFLESRPDRRDILRHQEPMSPEVERTWLELVRRSRSG